MKHRRRTSKEMAKPTFATRLDLRDAAMMADFVFQGIPNMTKSKVFRDFCIVCLKALQKSGKIEPCLTYRDARDRLEKVGIYLSSKEMDWKHVIDDLDEMNTQDSLEDTISKAVAGMDFEDE